MTDRRVALVTGASRGIGLAVARRLAADGFDLMLSARSQESLVRVASTLAAPGGRVETAAADMQHPSDVEGLAAAHLSHFQRLDLLVLCAGMGIAGPLADFSAARMDKMFAVNVRAPLQLTQLLLPALRSSAAMNPALGARVIALASITGVASEKNLAAYGATKAALISLCESLTVEEADSGVSATAISPGYVDTDMTQWLHAWLEPGAMIRADDVAELVAAICRLSRFAAIPNVVLTRPGDHVWRA